MVARPDRKHDIACDWRAGHATVPIKARQERNSLGGGRLRGATTTRSSGGAASIARAAASDRYLARCTTGSGHLHPLEYALGLARAALAAGVRIFEHSRVTQLVRGSRPVFKTAEGEVHCDFAVLAGNALVYGIAPELDAKIMPVGTYIGATAPLGEERARALIGNDMAVADTNWALDYFRRSRDTACCSAAAPAIQPCPRPTCAAP